MAYDFLQIISEFPSTDAVQEEIPPTVGSVKFKTDLKEEV